MQGADFKTVGIIGAGKIGHAMAPIALRAGRSVVIANKHGPESLGAVVEELGGGVSAGTVKEAAAADIVVMWPDVPEAVNGLTWEGRIVIDPTNDFDPSDLNGWRRFSKERDSSRSTSALCEPADGSSSSEALFPASTWSGFLDKQRGTAAPGVSAALCLTCE